MSILIGTFVLSVCGYIYEYRTQKIFRLAAMVLAAMATAGTSYASVVLFVETIVMIFAIIFAEIDGSGYEAKD